MDNNTVEQPVVTIDDFHNEEETFVLHNYVNQKGKLVMNKAEASLLFLELYKFIKK